MSRFAVFSTSFFLTLFLLPLATLATFSLGSETGWFSQALAILLISLFFLPSANLSRFYFFGAASGITLFSLVLLPLVGNGWTLGVAALGMVVLFARKRGFTRPPVKTDPIAIVLGLCSYLFPLFLATNLHRLYGNFIYHFVFTLVFFLTFQGVGNWVSKWLEASAKYAFPILQLMKALLGAASVYAVLEVAATHNGLATLASHFAYASLLGFIAGVEVPLLGNKNAREKMTAHTIGGLLGCEIFFTLSFFFDPTQGVLLVAILNLCVLLWLAWKAEPLKGPARVGTLLILVLLIARFAFLIPNYDHSEIDRRYYSISPNSKVVLSLRTSSQKILAVLTPSDDIEPEDDQFPEFEEAVRMMSGLNTREQWISLYRNGSMQVFSPLASETDFFHHAFAHPTMLTADSRKQVVILGGGDGLTAKEVLKYSDVESLTIVEKDKVLVHATKTHATLREHTSESLNHAKVKIIYADPVIWARNVSEKFDIVLVDALEEHTFPFLRYLTLGFLKSAKLLLKEGGSLALPVENFDSPSYWNIVRTAFEAGFEIIPHHTLDPRGFEGILLLTLEPKDMEKYAASLEQHPFVIPQLLLTAQALEYYARPEIAQARSQSYPVNTALRPTFLRYYPGAIPWTIPNSKE